MSVDALWYDDNYVHYRQRNIMKDVAFRQFYKPTAMELKNGNVWRKYDDHWNPEFLTLYANGIIALFNEPYGTCNGLINIRSNVLDVDQGPSIPVSEHRMPMLPEWATQDQLILIRGHKENFYFLFKSAIEAKSWVMAINNTRAMIPGGYDTNPPLPGFYPFGQYVPPGYPSLNTRTADKPFQAMPQAVSMPPVGPKTHSYDPKRSPRKKVPVAVENVDDRKPYGRTDPIVKPVFRMPEDPGQGWNQYQKANYVYYHDGGRSMPGTSRPNF